MVERFNERFNELLQQTRCDSMSNLKKTPLSYLKLYYHHIPQRAIGTRLPIQALKSWHDAKPELLVKRVYEQARLDSWTALHINLINNCTCIDYRIER
jgi:hypothetical protein